ncbi:MAG: ABC transporter substrate-binding protein [Balneolaceae bacterium]
MNRFFFSILLLLASMTVSTLSVSAQTAEQEIRSLLESRDSEIKEIVGPKGTELEDSERERLKSLVNDIIDFESMARYALASTWESLESDVQQEFVSIFTSIVRDHSLSRLEIYRAEVLYEEIVVEEGMARVETIAQLEESRIPVGYTLEQRGPEWVIIDMYIDDVSTSESYRTQFQSIIRQRGFDALLENLRRKAVQT